MKVNENILEKDMEVSAIVYRSWSSSFRRRLKHPEIPLIAWGSVSAVEMMRTSCSEGENSPMRYSSIEGGRGVVPCGKTNPLFLYNRVVAPLAPDMRAASLILMPFLMW